MVSSHYLMMPNTRSISFRYHISSGVLELMPTSGRPHSCGSHASVLESAAGPLGMSGLVARGLLPLAQSVHGGPCQFGAGSI